MLPSYKCFLTDILVEITVTVNNTRAEQQINRCEKICLADTLNLFENTLGITALSTTNIPLYKKLNIIFISLHIHT